MGLGGSVRALGSKCFRISGLGCCKACRGDSVHGLGAGSWAFGLMDGFCRVAKGM